MSAAVSTGKIGRALENMFPPPPPFIPSRAPCATIQRHDESRVRFAIELGVPSSLSRESTNQHALLVVRTQNAPKQPYVII